MSRNKAGSGRDDSDLNNEPPTPSQSGSSGGTLATDIGSEDEEKTALAAIRNRRARPRRTRSSHVFPPGRTMQARDADGDK